MLNLSIAFHAGKQAEREAPLAQRAWQAMPVAYCNLRLSQDELVFDGASMAVKFAEGELIARVQLGGNII
jgi:hypothetical protein